jgi:hypothetical protein
MTDTAKTIVTHISPDLDAIASSWLVKKYLPEWKDAEMAYVPASTTLNDMGPDSDPNIIHVDTGGGQFDHHQSDSRSSATKLVFDFLVKENHMPKRDRAAVSRIVEQVNEIDNFAEATWPDPTNDIYDFGLHQLIFGIKGVESNPAVYVPHIMRMLDGLIIIMKNKISAEEELENGYVFNTKWGKGIAFESRNEETLRLALKTRFAIAMRRDPKSGFTKIKAFPTPEIDLTPLYELLQKKDSHATWYLVGSNHILLDGSTINPHAKKSSLPFSTVIEITKTIA